MFDGFWGDEWLATIQAASEAFAVLILALFALAVIVYFTGFIVGYKEEKKRARATRIR